jgi:DNA-binding NarL/FixJ family response regulator
LWTEIADALHLTPREWEIVTLVFEGKTREAIANRLNVKVRTVRHHLERIYQKLDVNDKVGLVLRIIRVRDKLVCESCPCCPADI